MTKRFLMAVVLPLMLAASVLAQPGSAPDEKQRAAEIEQRLVAWLGSDAETIHVVAVGSRAFLTGVVENRVTQELADEVALASAGVRSTRNRIQARTDAGTSVPHRIGDELRDTLLEIRVKRELQREGLALARALEVEAVDGVVSLRGQLESAERKELAMSIATKVEGVTRVLDLVSYLASGTRVAG